MGDLNATEQSKGVRNLIAALGLVDTFREANPAAPGFTVWQPVWLERPFASRRVDFILLAPGANTRGRVVLNQPSRTQGRVLWPSDHYGVLSEVQILRRAGDGKARGGRVRAPIVGVARSSSFGFRATAGGRAAERCGSVSGAPGCSAKACLGVVVEEEEGPLGHRREVADRGIDHGSAPSPATALETVRSVLLRRACASRHEPALGPEVPLARNVVHLDADPVRVLEQL